MTSIHETEHAEAHLRRAFDIQPSLEHASAVFLNDRAQVRGRLTRALTQPRTSELNWLLTRLTHALTFTELPVRADVMMLSITGDFMPTENNYHEGQQAYQDAYCILSGTPLSTAHWQVIARALSQMLSEQPEQHASLYEVACAMRDADHAQCYTFQDAEEQITAHAPAQRHHIVNLMHRTRDINPL